MDKQTFTELTGENPEDILGGDWANIVEDWTPKDPIQYDDVKLKVMTCSHIEQDKFIMRDGTEQIRCKACKIWDSGDTV
jgi:hypothetical protein